MTISVYAKTPKGIQEVETKANGLSMRERWVLIYVDGKRTLEDLKVLPRVDNLMDILSQLEAGGYIEPLKTTASQNTVSATNSHASVVSPASVNVLTFRPLPVRFDPDKFTMAKNFMINTLNAFKGMYGATSLVRDIDRCQTHEALRGLFDRWDEAISGTVQGKKQSADLRKKLLDVI